MAGFKNVLGGGRFGSPPPPRFKRSEEWMSGGAVLEATIRCLDCNRYGVSYQRGSTAREKAKADLTKWELEHVCPSPTDGEANPTT
jgi:hypothetical protein